MRGQQEAGRSPRSLVWVGTILTLGVTGLNLAAQTVTKVIHFPKPTVGVAVNAFTNRVYVAAPSFGGASDTLVVIDGKSDTILANISVPRGAQYPVVDVDHHRVFVAGCDTYEEGLSCLVTRIDADSNTITGSMVVTRTEGDGILGAALNPATGKLYLANASDLQIDVVDVDTLKAVETIATNSREPYAVAFNPTNQRLYAAYYTNEVDIFQVATRELVATSHLGHKNVALAVDWLSGAVFVSDHVPVLSTAGVLGPRGKLLAQVPVSQSPAGLDVDPVTGRVFVTSNGSPAVDVIDSRTNRVLSRIPGIDAEYASVNFSTAKVYLSGKNGVTVLTEK